MSESAEKSLQNIEKEFLRLSSLPTIAGGAPASSEYTLGRIQEIIKNWTPNGIGVPGPAGPAGTDPTTVNNLPAATTPLNGNELSVVVQDGTTKRTTAQDIADLGGGGGGNWWETVVDNGGAVMARNQADDADIQWFKSGTFVNGGDTYDIMYFTDKALWDPDYNQDIWFFGDRGMAFSGGTVTPQTYDGDNVYLEAYSIINGHSVQARDDVHGGRFQAQVSSANLLLWTTGLPTVEPAELGRVWEWTGDIAALTSYLAGGGRLMALGNPA